MKKLFYLLLLFSLSQRIEAQIFEVDPYENVPKGENVIFTDVMPWKTNGIKYPIVVTQKHAYVNAREIYFSDELDIIDASYKLTFGGLKEQRFLVLLSDRSVIELRPTNISIKWTQKSLGKFSADK